MTIELSFFHECDHRIKSEPLILDAFGIAETSFPIVDGGLKIIEENIKVQQEAVVRSTDTDIDTLIGPIVTHIDSVTQKITHNGIVEIRQFKPSFDYILTNERLILWKDTANLKPLPGRIYLVDYRISREIYNFRVIDSNHIKVGMFDLKKSYIADYGTMAQFCTKCMNNGSIENGTQRPGIMQDIRYGPTGDFVRIQGVEKLKQELIRAVLAIRGSNPREPFYGTSIESSIGTAQNSTLVESLISQEVRNSLGLLRTLHRLQAGIQPGFDPAEMLMDVLEVKLVQDRELNKDRPSGSSAFDPTAYILTVVVQNGANSLVDFFVPLDALSKTASVQDVPVIEISDVNVSSIGRNQAVITWKTNVDTDSIIEFGEGEELGNREPGIFGKMHIVTLAGLNPATLYNFRIVTLNRGFMFGSAEIRSFKTLP